MLAVTSVIWLRKLLLGGEFIKPQRCPARGLGAQSLFCLHQPSKGRVAWSGGHQPTFGLRGLLKPHLLPARFLPCLASAADCQRGGERNGNLHLATFCRDVLRDVRSSLGFSGRWGQTLRSVRLKHRMGNKARWVVDHCWVLLGLPMCHRVTSVWQYSQFWEKHPHGYALSAVFLAFSGPNSVYVLRVTLQLSISAACADRYFCGVTSPWEIRFATRSCSPSIIFLASWALDINLMALPRSGSAGCCW